MNKKGFTLIELLIVIAVLGVLAGGILVAINPIEQMAKGRDSGRKTALSQMSNSLLAYSIFSFGYPAGGSGGVSVWADTLVSSGELKAPPGEIQNNNKCTTDVANGIYEVAGYC